ncbi:MAG TPA: FkbM family methyltransferase [Longimicrobium sp.]
MPPRWIRALHPRRLGELTRALQRFENHGAFARAYLRPGSAAFPLELAMRSGWRITLRDGHDAATAWVVFCREEYQVPLRARCIVDIGANFGAFSLYAAMRAPWARVVSLEPHPHEFPRLRDHVLANGLDGRIQAMQVAVAADAGARWMDADPAHPGPSRGIHPASADGDPPPESVPVRAITLMEALDRARAATGADRISLVKMDIEGAEHEILPDLHPDTLYDVDAWVMEYHPNGPRAPLFAALERAGLRLVRDVEAHPDSGVAHFRRD